MIINKTKHNYVSIRRFKGLFRTASFLEHLAENYSGDKSGFDYGDICEADIEKANDLLKNMEVLVAYESVGSWGCDSSSFFLLKDKTSGKMFEVHGGHCSCFGFEGQLQLEETTIRGFKIQNKQCKISLFNRRIR